MPHFQGKRALVGRKYPNLGSFGRIFLVKTRYILRGLSQSCIHYFNPLFACKLIKKAYFCLKFKENMATVTIQQVSTETVKEAIITLIQENNTEFKQLIAGLSPKKKNGNKKKTKVETPITVVKKERVPYHEMPFWKANPHLKPRVVKQGDGMSMEAVRELQAFFKEPGNEITDKWFEMLD